MAERSWPRVCRHALRPPPRVMYEWCLRVSLPISRIHRYLTLVHSRFPTLKVISGHLGERIPSDLLRINERTRLPPLFSPAPIHDSSQNSPAKYPQACRCRRTLPSTSSTTSSRQRPATSRPTSCSSMPHRLGSTASCTASTTRMSACRRERSGSTTTCRRVAR